MKRIFSILLAAALTVGSFTALAAEEAVINNDFESGESGFSARGTATVTVSKDTAYGGETSMLVSGRGSNAWEGVGMSIINDVKLDETYYGQMYVKAAEEGDSFTVKMTLEKEDETGMDYPQVGSAKVNGTSWTLVEGTWLADYQGNLKTLNLNLETESDGAGKSFYVDNIFFAHESVPKPSVVQTPVEVKKDIVSYSGNVIPEDIAENPYLKHIDKLMALGVVNGYPDGTFKPDNQVTRAEFLTMLLRLLKVEGTGTPAYTDVPADHFAAGAIAWATGMGICNGYGGGLFGPDDHVTYAQAVKMLMSVMGYGPIAEQNGGYPSGYMTAANSEDIYVSGSYSMDYELTRAMTAELMCSALDVDMYMRNGNGDISRETGRTILTEYYNGDIDRGYVESSSDASTTGSHTGINTVNIDGDNYFTGSTRAGELVGYYADYIYGEINGDYTLLYIEPQESRTTEFKLNSKDIESYSDYEYDYYTENGRTKTLKLEKDFNLIYNGQTVAAGYYDDKMMKPEIGEVRLVGSDSGRYNIVYVTSYETVIVSSVNRVTGDVYDINSTRYSFGEGKTDISYIKPDGTEGSFSDIHKDDILHIAASSDREKMTVRIVRSTVSGKVSSISDEDISIDGAEYELSDAYINRNYRSPSTGTDITAYLDINGDVVYIDEGGNTSMEVGYLINAAVLDSGDELIVRYLDSKGAIKTSNVASTVYIDGESYTSSNVDTVLKLLCGGDEVHRRIFRYSMNKSDEIRRIDFARAKKQTATEAEKNEGENSLYPINDTYVANDGKSSSEAGASAVRYVYKYNAKTFIDESGNYSSLALSPDTLLFIVPDGTDKASNDEYEVARVSGLGYDERYKVFAYKSTTDGLTADYAVLFRNGTGSTYLRSQEGYVVTSVFRGVNSSDETVPGLKVYMNGQERSYLMRDASIYADAVAANDNKDIEAGDIVRFDTDSAGEISNVAVDHGSGSYGDYFYSAEGYIYLKDDGYAYFTSRRPDASSDMNEMTLIPIDSFSITVYNKRTKEAYSGVSDEIIDYMTDPENYSRIYITMNYENAKNLICVVDY